ncbi:MULTISPECIES: hypothetical protein [unclassified Fictibacillus]|uniref:hypothetical protein n=1 Tax=unclassified Fictibacillus TaxID=2644029 RepID=UPI0006A78445|nr:MULTISPECIES: hypothetical protein [unclassified Fictibacillus]MED2974536.1 hypothetical protein [Fictibacillus sp. B-59209]UZJ77949.1 hypothetical protein OKX00_17570 [Fictibacillus sp. KU28468]SFE33913.1 hypothetical protein SAMN05428981_10542 [Bacillus sp. OV194]
MKPALPYDVIEVNNMKARVIASFPDTVVADFKEFQEVDPQHERQVIKHGAYKIVKLDQNKNK